MPVESDGTIIGSYSSHKLAAMFAVLAVACLGYYALPWIGYGNVERFMEGSKYSIAWAIGSLAIGPILAIWTVSLVMNLAKYRMAAVILYERTIRFISYRDRLVYFSQISSISNDADVIRIVLRGDSEVVFSCKNLNVDATTVMDFLNRGCIANSMIEN